MARATIYVRISRDKIGAGLGVDKQEADCRALAERLGHDVVKVYRDNDMSAYSGKPRKGYLAMLRDLAAGSADVVLAWHTDRLHRSNTELETYITAVERHGVVTETVKAGPLDLSTPSGRMIARQLCTIARYESEHRAERVSSARERQAQQGKFGGGRRPYGFEADGVTLRPAEAAEIVKMADAVLAGQSLASLARDLDARGVPTAGGLESWRATTVRDVLVRPRNAGLMVHKSGTGRKVYGEADVVGRAPWDAIIPEDTWRAVVSKIQDPSRKTTTGPTSRWLGSGVYRCPCGSVVRVYKAGDKASRPIYRCQDGRGPGHATCPQADLDALVEGLTIVILARDAADLIAAPAADVDVPALRSELIALRQRAANLTEDYAEGLIDRAAMLAGSKRVQAKIEDLERRLADAADSSPLAPFAGVESEDAARKVWEGLGVGAQREVVKAIMTVTLKTIGRGFRPTIDQRVTIEPIKPQA